MSGVPFDEYWPRPEIHQPLYETACIGTSAAATPASSIEGGLSGLERGCHLHPNFSAPLRTGSPAQAATMELLRSLDDYPLEDPAPKPARAAPPVRTPSLSRPSPPFKRNVTVSVLYAITTMHDICQIRSCHLHSKPAAGRGHRARRRLDRQQPGDYRDFGRRYPFVRILKNETNRGLLYSINRALQEARCDFVVWAAADDLLMPVFLACNAQFLSEYPAAGMTFSRLAVFKDGSEDITPFTEKNYGMAFDFGTDPRFLSPQMLRDRLQRSHLWISANTAMVSRAALIQIGGFDAGITLARRLFQLPGGRVATWGCLHPRDFGSDAPTRRDLLIRGHGQARRATRHIGPTGGQADKQGLP